MPSYNEIELIEKVERKEDRIGLYLLFIEEYGGWLQHLNSIDSRWGSGGEEKGANYEAVKTRNHLQALKNKIIELSV